MKRIISGFAVFAILLNSFIPLIANAGRFEGAGPSPLQHNDIEWRALCTSTGDLWIRLDASGRVLEKIKNHPNEHKQKKHTTHCALCLNQGIAFKNENSVTWSGFWATYFVRAYAPILELSRFQISYFSPAVRAPPATI